MQAGCDWFLARNKSCDSALHHRCVLVGRLRRSQSRLLSSSRVFEAMDRSLSRRPRGGCEARVRRGTRQCRTGASKLRSRDDDAGRLARDFSGALGREARASCVVLVVG